MGVAAGIIMPLLSPKVIGPGTTIAGMKLDFKCHYWRKGV